MKQVIIIPCSGIGKSLGTVGRLATYKVTDELRPEKTRTVCLPLLTVGDEETIQLVKKNPCITIDGCPAQCSKKNVEASHGKLSHQIIVTNVLRENRTLKPTGVIELNPEGNQLAEIIAEKISKKVDEIIDEEEQ
ncbi:MAG TPA: putative zinc-binding protein [Candidatus Bathyarchaeia archaeon]